jgi:DNA modification methylase
LVPSVQFIQGHVIDCLRQIPAGSVNCVVTSPPYWGLRDYKNDPVIWGGDSECEHEWKSQIGFRNSRKSNNGSTTNSDPGHAGNSRFDSVHDRCSQCSAWRGCLGLEPTIGLYVQHLVEVFREVRRVMRKDATLWLNIGDSYAGGGNGGGGSFAKDGIRCAEPGTDKHLATRYGSNPTPKGLKPKDLCGIPWRVALALQADGWWLRSDIIWAKGNPMPESVTDRPTRSHEYIFLLTKDKKYHYDADAIKEPASSATHARISQDLAAQVGSFRANGGNKTNGPMRAVMAGSTRKIAEAGSGIANNRSYEAALALKVERVNKRSVWTVATQPFGEAHFATFPPELIRPCILAGAPAGGVVLDPFAGSFTTCMVALQEGRNSIGIEANLEYVEMGKKRCAITPGFTFSATGD